MLQESTSIPASIRAEAAAWLARLHSEERTRADEERFRAWLAMDGRHQEAFDLVTLAWDAAGGLKAVARPDRRPPVDRRAAMLAAAALVLVVSVIGAREPARSAFYSTQPLELRRVVLEDGSAVVLDTGTRIRVDMHRRAREVRMEKGRAHFEVVKDSRRPFSVVAGGEKVVALGTAFDVALDRREVEVTLLSGKVSVAPIDGAAAPRLLKAGDRLVIEDGAVREADRPDMIKMMAWRRGRAGFADETLADAIRQINRYSRRPLVIGDEAVAAMRVSGVYSTTDSEAFAQSIAELLPVTVQVSPSRIVLRADPP
ncbi:MAG: FecR domain-containing protein [Sphingomonadales bacterium]